MGDTQAQYIFDPKNRFNPNAPVPPRRNSTEPTPMTPEIFISLIDARNRVSHPSKKAQKRDAAAVKRYNERVRAMFGSNLRRFVSEVAERENITVEDVFYNEAATNTCPETHPEFIPDFNGAERTLIVDAEHPIPDSPIPELHAFSGR